MPSGAGQAKNPHPVLAEGCQHPIQLQPTLSQSSMSRNVSFAKDSDESTAYREHNPPTVLRRQEAARREMSPHSDHASLADERPSLAHPLVTQTLYSHDSSVYNIPDIPSRAQSQNPASKSGFIVSQHQGQAAGTGKQSGTEHHGCATTSSYNTTVGNHGEMRHGFERKAEEVHILVAVTGSVATIKVPQIIHKLKQTYRKRAIIQLVVTRASTAFFDPEDISRDVKIWYDSDEWQSRQVSVSGHTANSGSDQQLHIRLRRWADILLVAPCSANTLAKFTYGICDNLLTSIFRVWNSAVPIVLAPAMNTHMYTNPVTKRHFDVLKENYPFVEILKPVEKVLVCGDIGMGGMREWADIVQILVKRIGVNLDSDTDTDSDVDN